MTASFNPQSEMVASDWFALRDPVSGCAHTSLSLSRFDRTKDALNNPFAGSRPMQRVFHKDGSVAGR